MEVQTLDPQGRPGPSIHNRTGAFVKHCRPDQLPDRPEATATATVETRNANEGQHSAMDHAYLEAKFPRYGNA